MKERFDTCVSLLSRNREKPFLPQIVTCDEKLILYDNRKRSARLWDKDQVPKYKPKPNIHQKKRMVTAWWSSHGLIHCSFIKLGQSITTETYCNQLDIMMKNLSEKQSKLVNKDMVMLLHDNACPHTANRTQLKILELDLETIDHLPYSQNILPADYHLFRNLDNFLQGKISNSQQAVENFFRAFIGFTISRLLCLKFYFICRTIKQTFESEHPTSYLMTQRILLTPLFVALFTMILVCIRTEYLVHKDYCQLTTKNVWHMRISSSNRLLHGEKFGGTARPTRSPVALNTRKAARPVFSWTVLSIWENHYPKLGEPLHETLGRDPTAKYLHRNVNRTKRVETNALYTS